MHTNTEKPTCEVGGRGETERVQPVVMTKKKKYWRNMNMNRSHSEQQDMQLHLAVRLEVRG